MMEHLGHFDAAGSQDEQHQHQHQHGIWIPTKAEPNVFNDMMVRFAMPLEDDWLWHPTTTSSLQPSVFQSRYLADPAHRFPEVATDGEGHGSTSHSPCFGTATGTVAAQWPQGSPDAYCQQQPLNTFDTSSYLVGQPRSAPAERQDSTSAYSWTPSHSVLSTPSAQATAGASSDDSEARPLHPPLTIPWPDVFASTRGSYQDPPSETRDGQVPQRKAKRSKEDLYTPHWIRNHGTQREGWCGWCCSWHTLRDSTYWYHMHYSHGISQVDGKHLPAPAGFRTFCESAEWEVKCGRCNKWMPLPPGDRWNTAYFRHTYKCYFKSTGRSDTSTPSSPVKDTRCPVRRTISNML